MKHHLIEVRNDLFNISKRLKSINSNYIVCYNRLNQSYELYSKSFNKLSFEKKLGNNLNCLAVKYVQSNSINNLEKIIISIDKQNAKIEKETKEKTKDLSKQILKDLINYANNQGGDVDFSREKIL